MTEIPKKNIPAFLSHNGEMAERIRSYDWSATPFGEPFAWPQSLQVSLSLALSSSFPMLLMWGSDLIQFYNDAFRPSLGIDGKHPSALGQRAQDCWAEIWDIVKPLLDEVRYHKKSIWRENQLIPIFRNGKMEDVYWTFSYSPVLNEDGSVDGILVVCAETTDKVRYLKQLEESSDQREFAIEAAELATWDFNPITNRFTANDRYTEWFGIDAKDLTDNDIALRVVADEDHNRVIQTYTRALDYQANSNYDIVFTIRPHNRPERILRTKGRAWFNEDKIAYRLNGTCEDVTEQVAIRKKLEENEARLEEKVRRRSYELYIQNETFKQAEESSRQGSYSFNLTTGELIYSDNLYRILEFDPQEFKPSLEEFNEHVHPEDRDFVTESAQKVLQTRQSDIWKYRMLTKSGKTIYIKGTGRVISLNSHDLLVGTLQDITNDTLLNEKLKTSNIELERQNEQLASYNYIASHDLQEPLRKIETFSSQLQAKYASLLPDDARHMLDKMSSASGRMRALIQDLLNYSRIAELDKFSSSVDLNEVIVAVLNDFELLIQEKNARIEAGKLPVLSAISIQMTQLFYNLLGNALKFTRQDVTPEIKISSIALPDVEKQKFERLNPNLSYCVISVRDNGIGFEKKYEQQVFNLFRRLHSKDEYSGTGIGLALSKKIVENHGGIIYSQSKENEGASFHVVLPV
jgi:signal transduction histidine kinase